MLLHQIKDIDDPTDESAHVAADAEADANEEALQKERAGSEIEALKASPERGAISAQLR